MTCPFKHELVYRENNSTLSGTDASGINIKCTICNRNFKSTQEKFYSCIDYDCNQDYCVKCVGCPDCGNLLNLVNQNPHLKMSSDILGSPCEKCSVNISNEKYINEGGWHCFDCETDICN